MAKSIARLCDMREGKALQLFVEDDGDVIVGAEVSTTLTVLVAVPALPEASVAVYVIVYEPTVSVSTVPVITTVTVPEASVAVAPSSL